MAHSHRPILLILSAVVCILIGVLGSCRNSSVMGTSIWNPSDVWSPVGYPAISDSNVAYTSMALTADGTPYVAFEDGARAAFASVMKFNGAGWVYVGSPGFSGTVAQWTSLAIDSNGILYVAFVDASVTPAAVSVMTYTGTGPTGWQLVGNADLSGSAGNVWQVSIAINPGGVPHVAYVDPSTSKATVMGYSSGTNTWVPVGATVGFSGAGASNVSLAFDKVGTPFVAFTDGSFGNRESVMTYTVPTGWQYVGGQGFSGSSVAYISLVVDSSGVPYVAYGDAAVPGMMASVMKYSGGAWSYVGNRFLTSPGIVFGVSLALSPTGNPYVAYQDGTNGPATVVQFSGGSWIPVGRTGFTGGEAQDISLAIDSNGTSYVAYEDFLHGGFATVVRLVK